MKARLPEDEIGELLTKTERNKRKSTQKILLDERNLLFEEYSKGKDIYSHVKLYRETAECLRRYGGLRT